jgi:hypothetical protein
VAATEEHRRMPGAERRQPAKRRTLDLDRPSHRPAARHFLRHPQTQQFFQLRLKIVFGSIGIERRLEVALGGQEPALEELLENLPVVLDLFPVGIFNRNRG